MDLGVIPPLVKLLKNGSLDSKEQATATLRNLSLLEENQVSNALLQAL